jgi:hypothetical protein
MHGENRLAERDGVGERAEAHEVESGDRYDREVPELIGALLLLDRCPGLSGLIA